MDHPCDNSDKNLVALMDGRMNGEESSSKKVGMRSKYTWDHQDDNILLGLGSMLWEHRDRQGTFILSMTSRVEFSKHLIK